MSMCYFDLRFHLLQQYRRGLLCSVLDDDADGGRVKDSVRHARQRRAPGKARRGCHPSNFPTHAHDAIAPLLVGGQAKWFHPAPPGRSKQQNICGWREVFMLVAETFLLSSLTSMIALFVKSTMLWATLPWSSSFAPSAASTSPLPLSRPPALSRTCLHRRLVACPSGWTT